MNFFFDGPLLYEFSLTLTTFSWKYLNFWSSDKACSFVFSSNILSFRKICPFSTISFRLQT